MHESEAAQQLRNEIDTRLLLGESTAVIEADFTRRFGPKVIAAKRDAPTRILNGLFIASLMTIALVLGLIVKRWRRPSTERELESVPSGPLEAPTPLDIRLDEELAELDQR
jgi:cytochrome c-type biogenesis protein CcmH